MKQSIIALALACVVALAFVSKSDAVVIVQTTAVAGGPPVVETYNLARSGSTAVQSFSVTKPTSSNDDLLLLVCMTSATNSSGTDVFDLPSTDTWTEIGEWGGSISDAHIGAWRRISDGTEAATGTCNQTSGNSDHWMAWYIVISGVDTTTPIDVSTVAGGGQESNGSSLAINALTTTQDDTLAIYLAASDQLGTGPHSVSGTGWVEEQDSDTNTTPAGNGASGSWGLKTVSTAGTTGSPTVSLSATDGVAGAIIVIAPQ